MRRLPPGVEAFANTLIRAPTQREQFDKAYRRYGRNLLRFQQDFYNADLPIQKRAEREYSRAWYARGKSSQVISKRVKKPTHVRALPRETEDLARRIRPSQRGDEIFARPRAVTEDDLEFARRQQRELPKSLLVKTKDTRALEAGVVKTKTFQNVYNLDIRIYSDAVDKGYTLEQLMSENESWSARGETVNTLYRRHLLEAFLNRLTPPALVSMTMTGLTPGGPQTPRKVIVIRSNVYRRPGFAGDDRHESSIQRYLEDTLNAALSELRKTALRVFDHYPDGEFRVLRISTEVTFAREAKGESLYRFLKKDERSGHLHLIKGGKERLKKLEKRYG